MHAGRGQHNFFLKGFKVTRVDIYRFGAKYVQSWCRVWWLVLEFVLGLIVYIPTRKPFFFVLTLVFYLLRCYFHPARVFLNGSPLREEALLLRTSVTVHWNILFVQVFMSVGFDVWRRWRTEWHMFDFKYAANWYLSPHRRTLGWNSGLIHLPRHQSHSGTQFVNACVFADLCVCACARARVRTCVHAHICISFRIRRISLFIYLQN